LGQATGVGIVAEMRGDPKRPIQSGQTNNPSKNDVGLDVSHHTCVFPRGRGEAFFLDILFHRMSDIAMLRQQQKSSSISGHVYGDNCENDSGGQRHRSDE
jgi:hypothetical protein